MRRGKSYTDAVRLCYRRAAPLPPPRVAADSEHDHGEITGIFAKHRALGPAARRGAELPAISTSGVRMPRHGWGSAPRRPDAPTPKRAYLMPVVAMPLIRNR
jgi:hypothetical protein